jgi:hypothetical protein
MQRNHQAYHLRHTLQVRCFQRSGSSKIWASERRKRMVDQVTYIHQIGNTSCRNRGPDNNNPPWLSQKLRNLLSSSAESSYQTRVRQSRLYHSRKDKQRCLQCSQTLFRVAAIVHPFQRRCLYGETECPHDGLATYLEVVCQWSIQNVLYGPSILPWVASRRRCASEGPCCIMEDSRLRSIYSTILRLLFTIHCQYAQGNSATPHCDAVLGYLKLLPWIRYPSSGVNVVRGKSLKTWERSSLAPDKECVVARPGCEAE